MKRLSIFVPVLVTTLIISACGGQPAAPTLSAVDVQSTAVAAAFTPRMRAMSSPFSTSRSSRASSFARICRTSSASASNSRRKAEICASSARRLRSTAARALAVMAAKAPPRARQAMIQNTRVRLPLSERSDNKLHSLATPIMPNRIASAAVNRYS